MVNPMAMANLPEQPAELISVGGGEYSPLDLARRVLRVFQALGSPESLYGLRTGSVHNRGMRLSVHVYHWHKGMGHESFLGTIRVTENGASYTGLQPNVFHLSGENFPRGGLRTILIVGDAEEHFKALKEADGFLHESKPRTQFNNYETLESLISSAP
ncbi:hypothetical protein HYV85_04820 [Candidatus Woesearchaeota archaeon]|nr:hypothetical protein [Candidatus Woesearchaeota archaeon]